MKRIITVLISVFLINTLFANPIDEQTAQKVAENFYQIKFPTNKKSGIVLTLAYKCASTQTSTKKSGSANAYYFVYNAGHEGFIIVAGDDASLPILGYSTESSFNPDRIPQNVSKWLEGYKEQLRYITTNVIQADETIKNEWNKILSGQPLTTKRGSVAPLIQTKWGQDPYVNDYCPYDYTYKENAVTGCPATAMAQIMKYWKYPQKGFGFHSYKHDKYGTLSANFSSTYYKWDDMPNEVTSANDAVATLMYHCGVAVEMNYNVGAEGGSGSYVIIDAYNRYSKEQTVEYALQTYFGYATTIEGLERDDYTDNEWITILKNELDEGRPVQYAGFGQGGHTFVCDGYDNNNFFHMNWGWEGMYDGYFNLNALSPGTGGTGSGAGTYNSGQQALIGIKPPDASQTYELEIYSDVVSDKTTISYGEGFTISTNISNDGTNAFSGDFCAAAFDESGAFVEYIEIKSDWSLGANMHYTNGINFTTEGLLALLPGTYNIYIYYRPTGGNWVGIKADYWSFTDDYTTIQVTNENDFRLYSSLVLTPDENIYKGQQFSVWLDVANYFSEQFIGTIDVSLYTLEGDAVATIEEKTGLTLNANSHYTNGQTFTTDNLDVEPGTYLLAVMHKRDGFGWELTGSTTTYLNPIKIIVQEPLYQADAYEDNDELSSAYDLNVSYSSNNAIVKTTGSNAHVGIDNDYYKVTLNAGYDYTINARLQDSYSNDDGQEYTLDGSFSYSLDGISWSDSYDDIIDSEIEISGANTVYFWISPYFTGETGTYQLDISIARTEQANLSVSTNALTVNAIANSTATFNVTSNTDWTANSNQSWLSISQTSGSGNQTITVTATENVSTSPRTATVTVSWNGVSLETVTVTQNGATPILTVSTTELTISATANSTATFSITSNIDWTITSNQTWLSAHKYSGTGNLAITLTSSANPTAATRTATVTIAGNGVDEQTITITQDAGTTSISDVLTYSINVYPNPANKFINIDLDNSESQLQNLNLFDLSGKLLYSTNLSYASQVLNIPITELTNGTYLIKIRDIKGNFITKKIIVQK